MIKKISLTLLFTIVPFHLWSIDIGSIEVFQENYFSTGTPFFDQTENFTPLNSGSHEYKNQISFQYSALYNILSWDDPYSNLPFLSFGFSFTQKSFWNFWDFDRSNPFWDSNFEVSPFGTIKVGVPGTRSTFLIFAPWLHQSNGGLPGVSRSWDRVVFTFKHNHLENDPSPWEMELRLWNVRPDSIEDNTDIENFLGWGDISLQYLPSKRRRDYFKMLGAGFKYKIPPFDYVDDLAKQKLYKNWLNGEVSLYFNPAIMGNLFSHKGALFLRWFYGYGENLLDYNQWHNTIRAGFIFFH